MYKQCGVVRYAVANAPYIASGKAEVATDLKFVKLSEFAHPIPLEVRSPDIIKVNCLMSAIADIVATVLNVKCDRKSSNPIELHNRY
ncbi:hypothetical protein [Nostoc sp. CALU 1950]|uniref:hypothetical protein n=1 Tax=Nostoc sp. CALU 1950 TaxID=3104321 RepID=UPI003EC14F71